jgi:histidine ammonia-lyase/tyrosine ammonia-lyase
MCQKIVEEEVNSCNDNPLIFGSPEEIFHGGNFHGQYVAMYADFLNVALTEVGVLAERQLNRLLDPHLNSTLPPFLAHEHAGLFAGFEGVQYLATSIASENLDLAAPASVKSIPSNGGNQDVVSMGLISVRKSLQLCENITTILSVLVAACFQASHFVERESFSQPVQEFHQKLSAILSLYRDSTPIYQHIEQVRSFLLDESELEYLDNRVHLD